MTHAIPMGTNKLSHSNECSAPCSSVGRWHSHKLHSVITLCLPSTSLTDGRITMSMHWSNIFFSTVRKFEMLDDLVAQLVLQIVPFSTLGAAACVSSSWRSASKQERRARARRNHVATRSSAMLAAAVFASWRRSFRRVRRSNSWSRGPKSADRPILWIPF